MKKVLFFAGMLSLAFVSCSKDDNGTVSGGSGSVSTSTLYNLMWHDSGATSGTTGTYIMSYDSAFLKERSNNITFVKSGYEIESSRTAYAYTSGGYLYNFSYGGGDFRKYSMPSVNGGVNYAQVGSSIAIGTATGSNNCRVSLLNDTQASGHNITTANLSDSSANYTTTTSTLSYAIVDLSSMSISKLGSGLIPTTATDEIEGDGKGEGTPSYVWRVHFPYSVTIGSDEYLYYGIARRRLVASSVTTDSNYNATAGVAVVKNGDFNNIEIMEAPAFGGVRTIGQTYGYRTNPFCEYNGDIYHVTMQNLRVLKINGSTGKYDSSYDFDLNTKASIGCNSGLDGTGMWYIGNGIAYVPYENNDLTDTYKWGIARVDLANQTAVAIEGLPANLNLWSYQQASVEDGKLYIALCAYLADEGNVYVFDAANSSPTGYTVGASLSNGGESYYSSIF